MVSDLYFFGARPGEIERSSVQEERPYLVIKMLFINEADERIVRSDRQIADPVGEVSTWRSIS